ncbi:hypothetical protein RHGRI_017707 [Rhododendron griersonianum]|uniref:Uncharacterized protein n=1 Tax=Rhododendron griersonianum TaxID=479676 RepID=A0AAV6JYT6_9ERIC|nr:hypothetical protein RHGRI_017707 [Rhododendron griersonianum]
MDPTFAIQLADEWSKLQDLLENTVGSDFSFRDPYVPTEFPIMYAQYQQLMANQPNQREVYTAQHPSPWRRARLEREIRDILESIPGFDIRNDPYYPHYRDMDSQPPIPTPNQQHHPPNTQEEDEATHLTAEVESLRAFMTTTPDFPMGDDYLAGMFPILYQMRQAHQRLLTLVDAITHTIVEDRERRDMLTYILGVELGPREEPPEEEEDPDEPPEEGEDPQEPAEEEEDPEEPPFPGSDHDYRLGPWQPEQEEPVVPEEEQVQNQEEEMDNAEPGSEGDAGNNTGSEDGFLEELEMDDYGWLLPIDAPRDMDAELQWWLTSQRLEMQKPPPSPGPVPMEESDSECEVIDADPPPRPKMTRPAGIPWVGHHSGYDPNTWVYIQLEPLYPCPFKIRAQSAYLGPVRTIAPCYNGYYLIAVPRGFQEHYTDRIHYSRVSRSRPEQEHRIISGDADFTDHVTFTEIPIRLEPYNNPNPSEEQQEPLWRVTWRCYGLTEDTIEKQSLLAEHFPVLFD